MLLHEKTFYYYKYFFNFNYYLLLSPYRVTCVDRSQPYIIVGGYFHQLLCIIVQLILALASMTMLFGAFNVGAQDDLSELSLSQDPMRLFQLSRAAGFPAYVLTLIACIWFQKTHFLTILQLVSYPSKTYSKEVIKIAAVTTIACLCAIFIAPFYMLGEDVFENCKLWPVDPSSNNNNTGEEEDDQDSNQEQWYWTLDCFYAYAGTVCHNLFLRPTSTPLTPDELTPFLISLTIIYGILNIYLIVVIHMADTFALIGALTIHSIGKEVSTILSRDVNTDMSTMTLMKYYGEAKELIETINAGTGPIVVCMFIVTVPYFVENLMVLFEEDDWALKIRFFYYFIHYFSIMVIASQANGHLNELKNWILRKICMEKTRRKRRRQSIIETIQVVKLSCVVDDDGHFVQQNPPSPFNENRMDNGNVDEFDDDGNGRHSEKHNDHWKLAIIYLETSTHNVGLKGCSFFTITFGFLGSIVSILLTYFVVMVQFKSPLNSKSSFKKPGTITGGTFVNPDLP